MKGQFEYDFRHTDKIIKYAHVPFSVDEQKRKKNCDYYFIANFQ